MKPAVSLVLFNGYGTILDVTSAVRRYGGRIGRAAEQFAEMWKAKQLEYTLVRSMMGQRCDYWEQTADALDYALDVYGLQDRSLRDGLLSAYRRLDAYGDVAPTLKLLRDAGLRTALLSNGTPAMLREAVQIAGVGPLFDEVLSIEEAGVFKPDPRVYRLACERFGLSPDAVAYPCASIWDAKGAAAVGFDVYWINREEAPAEYQSMGDVTVLPDLHELPGHLKIPAAR